MTDLITLEEFQSIKGVGKTGSDQRISALIPQVSALVRKYCNRAFTRCVCTQEIYAVWDEPFLLLQEIPVISVESIHTGPIPSDPDDDEEVSGDKYFVTKHSGQIRRTDGCWEGPETYRISYTAGFKPQSVDPHEDPPVEPTYPDEDDYPTGDSPPVTYEDALEQYNTDLTTYHNFLRTGVPEDIKLATIDVVNYYLKEEYKEAKTAQAFSIDVPGTSSLPRTDSFPDHISRVLDMYKLDDLNG